MFLSGKEIEHVLYEEKELLGILDGVKVLLPLFCDKKVTNICDIYDNDFGI
jgi:hypothetical protein